MSIYTGTSGLALPVPNKQHYPPEYREGSRLHYYSSLFSSIEVNSSFYKVPLVSTVRRWATEVPENFKFTYKLWREITHQKGLEFSPADIDRFMQVINAAEPKKGALLVQFPASIRIDHLPQVTRLLHLLRLYDPYLGWKIAIEFRHHSWYQEQVYELLLQYQMGMVIHDIAASAAPMNPVADDFAYLRFHGPEGGYRGSYSDDFLYEYAQYIKEWRDEGKAVYVYFNNTLGEAVRNLMRLNQYLKE